MATDNVVDGAPVGKKHAAKSPQAQVRKLIKKGRVKKKCCTSTPRCKKCPVLALQRLKDAA